MKLIFSQRTDPGLVRTSNQDACSVDLLDPRGNAALLLVADGMGGYEGGEIASQIAVQTVRNRVLQSAADWAEKGRLAEGLTESFLAANQAILQAQDQQPQLESMGTTLTAALVWGERVFLAHVGDSKASLLGKAGAVQVTTDHTVAAELLQGGHITVDQAAVHPQRHVLTRALGTGLSVPVERQELIWQQGETLVMYSDGLSNLVMLSEIEAMASEVPLPDLPDRLVALANSRGGHDNITVLLARWEG